MQLNILKCHGMGNDYVLLDTDTMPVMLNERQMSKLASLLSSRKGVVGADGVVFVSTDSEDDALVRIFNPSGSESQLCLNGLRCAARYIAEKTDKVSITLRTASGSIRAEVGSEPFPGIHTMTTFVGSIERTIEPHFFLWPDRELWDSVIMELSPRRRFYAVTINVPHIISIVDMIDLDELVSIGRTANLQSSLFPQGVNVSFAKLLSDSMVYVRTYERGGAGLTYSCASAMLASCFVICELSNISFNTHIESYCKGGKASVVCSKAREKSGIAEFNSSVTFVYRATIEYDPEEGAIGSWFQGEFNDLEVAQYDRYLSNLRIGEIESEVVSSNSSDALG